MFLTDYGLTERFDVKAVTVDFNLTQCILSGENVLKRLAGLWMRMQMDSALSVLCFRYEQDSGHDSGSEDACVDSSQPFTLVTIGMKKVFIPKSPTSNEPENRVLPMPTSIGVFLDCDKGKVAFYDMDHMKCLYERQVDCSHMMYPAFALMGSGGVQLEESISAKYLEYQENM